MKKKIFLGEMKGKGAISYLTIKNIPMYDSPHGPIIDLDPFELETFVACVIVKSNQIPIRGGELSYIRNALDLSLEKFGGMLGLSHATVRNWESQKEKRLDMVSEIAVRALAADKLRLEIKGSLKQMWAQWEQAPLLEVDFKKGA